MKMKSRTLICLLAMLLCVAASAQELKPVKDKSTKKYGYQDKAKNWVIPPSFDSAKKFDEDGCALVKKDDRQGLINRSGEWILPPEYDDIGKFDKNGLCEIMVKEGKTKYYGVANRAGDVLLPVVFHSVKIPRKGEYITASREVDQPGLEGTPLWGVYDLEGREVFPPRFLSAPSFSEGTFIAKDALTGLSGVASMDGEILLPFDYLSVDHFNARYKALSRDFTRIIFSSDMRQLEAFHTPGAVIPYDPMGDPVRAAAWHCNLVGTRLHSNQVRVAEWQSGTRTARCYALEVDWRGNRFLRLEPFEADQTDADAMYDPLSGKKYTLKALLYEADGTLVGTVSDYGYLEAESNVGLVYRAEGKESWIVFYDPNSLSRPSYTLNLAKYSTLSHDVVYSGLGIRSADVERLAGNVRRMADRTVEIIEGDNIGASSYLPPVVDMGHARRERELTRAELFHHNFHMGDVVSCSYRTKGEEVEVDLYEQLVIRFNDHFSDPSYSMYGDEVIYWGPNNARTVRVSLEPTYASDALLDDVTDGGKHWNLVLSMYEEDGTWLRTLATVPYAEYAQEGVILLKNLNIALLSPKARLKHRDSFGWSSYRDIRGEVNYTVRLPGAKPLPHTLSALAGWR